MRPSCVLDSLHVSSLQLSSSPFFSSLSVFIQSSFGRMHPPNLPRRGKSMFRAIFRSRLGPPPDGLKFHPKTCVSLETSLKNGISEASLFRSIFVTIFGKTCVSRGTSLKNRSRPNRPSAQNGIKKITIFVLLRGRQLDFALFHFSKKNEFFKKKNRKSSSRLHETPIFAVLKKWKNALFLILDFSKIAYFHGFSSILLVARGPKAALRRI